MSKEKYVQDDQEEQCRRIAMALYRSAGLDQPVDDLAPRLPPNVMARQALTPSTETEEEDQGGKIVNKQAGMSSKEIQIPPRKAEDEQMKSRSHQGRTNGNVESTKRKQLLIFIKIILKCLDHEDPTLHLEAKQIITECTKKNREKESGYDNLSDAITRKLRIAVGERHWSRAETLLRHYLKTRPISNNIKVNYAEV